MYSSNYTDLVGQWSSNYGRDKIGIYSSNYSEIVGQWSSNYGRDKIGIYSSNYSEIVGQWNSNYTYDKVGMYSSNYSDKIGIYGSNYSEKLTTVTSLIDKFSENDFSLVNNKIFPLKTLGYCSILVKNIQVTYAYINATTGLTHARWIPINN